jgi:hypothetical protein
MKQLLIIICLNFGLLNLRGQNCPPVTVCTDFANTPNGTGAGGQFGEINAGTDGCLNGEHNSTWIDISISLSGTLDFTINPNNNNNDFDFAVWGPNTLCPPSTPPIRCSYAVKNNNFAGTADNGNTGIGTTINNTHPQSENDVTEGAGGNGWVNTLNVLAGEKYLLLIDNFTTNSGFLITFPTGAGSSSLSCVPLPIHLIAFEGYYTGSDNLLTWKTATEMNNDYFTLERSTDGYDFTEIAKIKSQGSSNSPKTYSFHDNSFEAKINYYRLKQTDNNGQFEIFKLLFIDNSREPAKIIKIIDVTGREVDEYYQGFRIIYYEDGRIVKTVGN